jgi:D-methionine transport system ATP-binding protein
LRSINREYGITIAVITHEMSVIKHLCSRAAVIENSLVVEEGNIIDLFSNPKTDTSKRFLKDTMARLPEGISLDAFNPCERLLRISFLGDDAGRPHISNIVRECGVTANIIAGNIENIQGVQVGSLIVRLSGSEDNIGCAVDYLIRNKLGIEVVKGGGF